MKGRMCALLALAACAGEIEDRLSRADGGGGGGGGGDATTIPGGIGEPAALAGITLYHNEVRAAVDTSGIAAGPLPPMQWDSALAAHASAWTETCTDADGNGLVDHSSIGYRSNAVGYSYIGENVFGSGGAATAQQAVDAWASEKQWFTYPTTCTGTCGHYTQIVWRTSVNLGCAIQTCNTLAYKGTVLCMYGPGGNGGGAPY